MLKARSSALHIALFALLVLAPVPSAAQQQDGQGTTEEARPAEQGQTTEEGQPAEDGQPAEEAPAAELPAAFSSIRLGMDMPTVKERLKSDPNFHFRGDPDVSMLREPNNALIEVRGYAYIDRAAFQFVDDGLYTITLILNRELLGFYTLFSTLQEKYGRPDSVTPDKMQWESPEVILALERPLRVKYIRRAVLEQLRQESRRGESLEQLSRERFLEQF
jgi:hypothetical protein